MSGPFAAFRVHPETAQKDKARQKEEATDYYQKWLNEDVVYIITDEERAVFEKLTSPEEKESFIEQFWFRRDPDPRTSINEVKSEHYRRIAYANEHFPSGDPGWLTDRGRIYILHGPPDSIESRPTGGTYIRPIEEGGGTTGVHPYEKWRYRRIEGLGDEIELEFVDDTQTGQYRLAVYPWEKDAFLRSPGGATLAEQTGIATKADREAFTLGGGGAGNNPQNMFRRLQDTPFKRYEKIAMAQAAKPLKFKDLKQLVTVNLSYSDLPFEARTEYFRLNEQQVLVPLTIQVRNQDLMFKTVGDGRVARMAIYGLVTGMTNRVVLEFDEEVTVSYPEAEFAKGALKTSVYQKVVPVDTKMRYKLDLVVKDLNSGSVGVRRQAIIPPAYSEALSASSLILSNNIQPLQSIPDDDQAFVLGDVRVLPNPGNRYAEGEPLGVYFQVYNCSLDQSSLTPSLGVTYKLLKDGQLLRMAIDEQGESIQFFSGQRVVVVKRLSLQGLESGDYEVRIEVADRVSGQQTDVKGNFKVAGAAN